jgi:phage gp36-like protein
VSAYCTQANIAGFISSSNLIALTDDTGTGVVDQGVLTSVITSVSNTVDGMLSATYQVPFTGNIPTLVAQAATIFACEALMGRRLVPSEQNQFTSRANMFREQLKQIAQNRGGLDAGTLAAFSPGIVQATCSLVNSTTA